jgi:hypothetical protein
LPTITSFRCRYTSEKARLGDSDDDLRSTLKNKSSSSPAEEELLAYGGQVDAPPSSEPRTEDYEEATMAYRKRDEDQLRDTKAVMQAAMPEPTEHSKEVMPTQPANIPTADQLVDLCNAQPPAVTDEKQEGGTRSSSKGRSELEVDMIERGMEAEQPAATSEVGKEQEEGMLDDFDP